MKITLKSLTVFLAVLMFSLTAMAEKKTAVITSKNGRTVFAQNPAQVHTPYVAPDTRAKVIYSNLAKKHPKGFYFALGGASIQGPNAGPVQWNAAPFTPAADATVTQIQFPIGYIFAFTSTDVIVSLNADSNGLPGTALQTWVVTIDKNVSLGSCCSVYTEKGSVPITGGQQYWIVVSTESDSDMYAAWNFNDTDEANSETNAYYDGTGWYSFQTFPGQSLGFAIYGQ